MKVPQSSHGACSWGEPRERQSGYSKLLRSFKLKRKFLFTVLALIPAALMPIMASSQVAPAKRAKIADEGDTVYKWEAYGGYAYTSLNMVTGSRSGLQGVDLSVTRDWGRFFGVTADGAFYKAAFSHPVVTNSTQTPSVSAVLFGPVIHANLYGPVSGFVNVLLGGEHVAGTSQTPNISFAGGLGGGMEWKLSHHLAVRASGDDIAASFSPINNSKQLGYSPHKTWSSRATIGVVYKF